MKSNHRLLLFLVNLFLLQGNSLADPQKSFRTFVTIKALHSEAPGVSSPNSSEVRLQIKLPDGRTLKLREKDIQRSFEIPFDFVKQDSFGMEVALVRKGKNILPCQITVHQLSQYNRSYRCQTDVGFQINQQYIPENKVTREGVELRVFTDAQSDKKEIPRKLLAFDR
jgi:hypothetical protein